MVQIILLWLLWLFSVSTGNVLNTPSLSEVFDQAKAYGENVFEAPQWVMTPLEQTERVRIEWRSEQLGAVGYIDYIPFGREFQPEELETYFNKRWFEEVFVYYNSWKERNYCAFDNLRLIEFDMVTSYNQPYKARVWLKYVNPHRVAYFFLIFPENNPEGLDTYSQRLFPNAWSCTGDS